MNPAGHPIYKGLQKPLQYKGFKGKYIYWGLASIFLGVIVGCILGAVTNTILSGLTAVGTMTSGITFTLYKQRSGMSAKTQNLGLYIYPNKMFLAYEEQ